MTVDIEVQSSVACSVSYIDSVTFVNDFLLFLGVVFPPIFWVLWIWNVMTSFSLIHDIFHKHCSTDRSSLFLLHFSSCRLLHSLGYLLLASDNVILNRSYLIADWLSLSGNLLKLVSVMILAPRVLPRRFNPFLEFPIFVCFARFWEKLKAFQCSVSFSGLQERYLKLLIKNWRCAFRLSP